MLIGPTAEFWKGPWSLGFISFRASAATQACSQMIPSPFPPRRGKGLESHYKAFLQLPVYSLAVAPTTSVS